MDAFRRLVEAGWGATLLDPWELAVAFCTEVVKRPRAGGVIRLDGRDYRAEELLDCVGQPVRVRQPLYGNRNQLFVFTEFGEPLAVALPDRAYEFGDVAGAGEQARLSKSQKRRFSALARNAPKLDALETMQDVGIMAGRGASPTPAGIIRLNPEISEAADMARQVASVPAGDRKYASQREQLARLARLDELNRAAG